MYGTYTLQGIRMSQEDTLFATQLSDGSHLFGVFDGHGGDQLSTILSKTMTEQWERYILTNQKTIGDMFLQLDDKLQSQISTQCGSTAVVAHLSADGGHLTVANCGDSRAILSCGQQLSIDHNIKNEDEKRRIMKSGGFWDINRVNGRLLVSRAFGDYALKKSGVTAEPHVKEIDISPGSMRLILCSDGLTDVASNEKIISLIEKLPDAREASQILCQYAIETSRDNVTVIVVNL